MGGPGHKWREVGRLPVSLVHRVCDCGCGKRMIQVVTPDGRALGFQVPALGRAIDGVPLQKVGAAVELGKELFAFWERVRKAVA